MSEIPFSGPNGMGNEFIAALLNDERFATGLAKRFGLDVTKADTVSQATNLQWYDLRPIVEMLYPYRELIPRISRLPRVAADGGNSFHWKRIVAVNVNGISSGVSEGNRGARIAIAEQDMMAAYKTLGFESSVTFEARYGSRNLTPEALGISVQSSLRSLMIDEEKILINGNAQLPLGVTPTPTLVNTNAGSGITGAFSGGTVYVQVVALTGMGFLGYTPYNATAGTGGVLAQVTKVNADGSSDTFGGGSAQPSAEASTTVITTQYVVASVTPVKGAFAYAWFVGSTSGGEQLAGLTPSGQAILTKYPSNQQPITKLQTGPSTYSDNSFDILIPDGILTQISGAILGPSPGQIMATNPTLPGVVTSGDTLTFSAGGSIVYTMRNGNSGVTINGSNIAEFDAILRAAYDQYKIGFDRILVSSVDAQNVFGAFFNVASTSNAYRFWLEPDGNRKIMAGFRVNSYLNKFFNNSLDVEIHPYIPPGTVVFWSDRSPYELSGVANLLEARVRQDYYQIQWPWRSRRYEYGVYADEVFSCYFTPAFAILTNVNPSTGSFQF